MGSSLKAVAGVPSVASQFNTKGSSDVTRLAAMLLS